MATGDNKKLNKISTSEILKELKKVEGDNTEFFYLYVSTAGEERKRQKRRQPPLPSGQQTINFLRLPNRDEESDGTESDDDDADNDDEQMEDDSVNITDVSSSLPYRDDNPLAQNTPRSASLSKDEARKVAMQKIHTDVLPNVLSTEGWRKVYDKDMKLTYRALYFNIIKKQSDEDDNSYTQRVGAIRQVLAKEADKVKKEFDVNFKINSLLSKPFLYNEQALVEQSMRAGSTQKGPKQTRMDDYVKQ